MPQRKHRTERLTYNKIEILLRSLDDNSLSKLIAAANAEDRWRFDERCAAHPANATRTT